MKNLVKIFAMVLVAILVLNIVLLALGKISELFFWIVIIFAGISSFVLKKFLKPNL